MNKYIYEGPVMEFDVCIAHSWTASTYAESEKKARSNLTYQFKKQNNRMPYAKITLVGEIKLAETSDTRRVYHGRLQA